MQLLSFSRVQKANTVTTVKTCLYLKIRNTYNIHSWVEKWLKVKSPCNLSTAPLEAFKKLQHSYIH